MQFKQLIVVLSPALAASFSARQDWHYLVQLFNQYGIATQLELSTSGHNPDNTACTSSLHLSVYDQRSADADTIYLAKDLAQEELEIRIKMSDFWPDRELRLSQFERTLSSSLRNFFHIVLDFTPANISQLLTALGRLSSNPDWPLQISFPASASAFEQLEQQLQALHLPQQPRLLALAETDKKTQFAYLHAADLLLCGETSHPHFRQFAKTWCIPALKFDASGNVDYHPFIVAGADRVSYLLRQRHDSQTTRLQLIHPALQQFAANLNLVTNCAAQTSQFEWQIEGPFDSNYSLSIVNRETARALAQAGQAVRLRSIDNATEFAPAEEFLQAQPDYAAFYQAYLSAPLAPHCSLRFAYPPHSDDQHAVIRGIHTYAWEESAYPAEYVREFNRKLDGISVMTTYVARILRQHGVRCPIKVSGTNLHHFQNLQATVPKLEPLKEFCFLHISSGFARKGIDVLLAAYGQAFTIRDPVSLILKSFPGPLNESKKWLAHYRAIYPEFPHVIDLECDLSAADIAGLYQVSHAFVAPCRAEGFGLPMAEAMLRNVPVITTGWGGQTDFCTTETAWLIDFKYASARSHLGIADSVWAEPEVQHLSELLREIWQAPSATIATKTSKAAELIKQRYTATVVQEKLRTLFNPDNLTRPLLKLNQLLLISPWRAYDEASAISKSLFGAMKSLAIDIFVPAINPSQVLPVNHSQTLYPQFDYRVNSNTALANQLAKNSAAAWVIHYTSELFDGATLRQILQLAKAQDKPCYLMLSELAELQQLMAGAEADALIHEFQQLPGILVFNLATLNLAKDLGLSHNLILFPIGAATVSAPALYQAKPLKLASLGALTKESGCLELILAFRQLLQSCPDAELSLYHYKATTFASSVYLNQCLELRQSYQLETKLHFHVEYLDDAELQAELAHADLVVFNQQQPGQSPQRCISLALASGKAIAMTREAGFDDYSLYSELLPTGDSHALALALLQLMSRPATKHQAILNWQKSRSWHELANRFINMLEGQINYPDFD